MDRDKRLAFSSLTVLVDTILAFSVLLFIFAICSLRTFLLFL
jgi:hypothetical protein